VLSSLLIKGVNAQLETGIVLPVPDNISELIVAPFVEIRDHFIVIQADAVKTEVPVEPEVPTCHDGEFLENY
jgi:hypothetical protein